MTTFQEVVEGWRVAPVTAIHPSRHISDEAYWETGRVQALDAAQWIPEGGSVVDFGCGDGRVAIPLAKLGFKVLAMDASEEMLYRVRENATAAGEQILTRQSDGFNHFYFNAPVDAIVCRAVLIHHSHKDVERLVGEFSKVLKPGGYLICDWPVGEHYVRQNWTDVTTWNSAHRNKVAKAAGFTMEHPGTDAHGAPSVWRKV